MKIEELPYEIDSATYYEKIRHLDWPVFLDSSYQENKSKSEYARFDIISASPFIKLSTESGITNLSDLSGQKRSDEPPLEILDKIMQNYFSPSNDMPFVGGAIGYCSYELNLKTKKKNLIHTMMMGIYDWALIVDHYLEKTFLVSTFSNSSTKKIWPKLVVLFNSPTKYNLKNFTIKSRIKENLSFIQYQKQFNRVMKYINSGDCYQINLSKKFEIKTEGDSWTFYKKFRELNKSPFMAYLSYNNFQILSGSPERFINAKDGKVSTRPIKGTRVRGGDRKKDQQNAIDLSNSLKDQSENLMIVDLLRNDLNVNCKTGSVKVDELFAIESYPNVHHLVSTISGQLKKESNNIKLFKDAFPGGSITGAPKIRAIEIIEELEGHPRDFYCGSVCYFSFNNSMDSNVAIRSMIHYRKKLHFYSGGGITVGSNADDEYQEIEDKAENIKQAINLFKE